MKYYLLQNKHTPNLPLYVLSNAFLIWVRSNPQIPCALYLLLNQIFEKNNPAFTPWDCLEKLALPISSLTLWRVWSLTQSPSPETGKLFEEIPIFYYPLDPIQAPSLSIPLLRYFSTISHSSPQLLSCHLFQLLCSGSSIPQKFFPLPALPPLTCSPSFHQMILRKQSSDAIPFHQLLHCMNLLFPVNYEQIRVVVLPYSVLYSQDLVHCLTDGGHSPVFLNEYRITSCKHEFGK